MLFKGGVGYSIISRLYMHVTFAVTGVPLAAGIVSTGVVCTLYTTLVSIVHLRVSLALPRVTKTQASPCEISQGGREESRLYLQANDVVA